MNQNNKNLSKLIKGIDDLKKLMILELVSDGVSDKAIGKTLGVSSARIRQFVSIKEAKKKGQE